MYTVYKHTSPNGKCYIGITSNNPLIRWSNGNGYSGQPYFFRAIMKYGWDNIKHEILFSDLSKEEACQKEIELIKFHKSNNPNYGYNISTGGEGSNSGSKRIGKVFFDKYKVLDYKNKKYTLLCLDCNKIFERTSGCFNKNSIIKCPFEVYRPKPKQYHYITYNGETLTASDWSKKLNIPLETIISRSKNGLDIKIGKVNKIKIIVQCSVCGKTFKRKDKQNKYCSKECRYKSYKQYNNREDMLKAKRERQKKYQNQKCLYNGEVLTLGALKKRLEKKGISNATIEAKKYLMADF